MFRSYPQPVREACLGLIVGGFLFFVFAGMGFYLMATDDVDDFGRILTILLSVVAISGLGSGFMLASRTAFAIPIAWVTSGLYLLVFPLGTIVGVIVIKGLLSKEMSTFIRRSSQGKTSRRPRN